jgi:hypothetical protein
MGAPFLGSVLFGVKKNEPGFGAEPHFNKFDGIKKRISLSFRNFPLK